MSYPVFSYFDSNETAAGSRDLDMHAISSCLSVIIIPPFGRRRSWYASYAAATAYLAFILLGSGNDRCRCVVVVVVVVVVAVA